MMAEVNTFFVTVYETDRAFGGPEEGGWWFDYGEPASEYLHLMKILPTLEEAQEYQKSLGPQIKEMNEGRHDRNSVLCEGWFEAIIDENKIPGPFPEERPHYE